MKFSRALLALPVLGLLAAGTVLPRAADAIEPGAAGIVRTVLKGSEIVEIPLEFLGLQRGASGPGHDLYLVRLTGEVAETVGVAGGMSGSPVYVGDRLIGALSYRMGFLPTEAVAGVTPIDEMLDASRAEPVGGGGGSGLTPIATPVTLGGFAAPIRRMLEPELERLGFVVVQGGGSNPSASASPLEPGSAVAVQLVRGDVSIAATGTVTLVEDGRVYAFGHPFLGTGRVEMPMAHAEIVHTLAALGGSVKLSNVGAEVGAIVEDRLTAVVGRIGRIAPMIPLSLVIEGGDHGRQTYAFEIVREPTMTALMAGSATANALLGNLGYDDAATIRVEGRVGIEGLPDLPVDFALSSADGADPYVAIAGRIIQLLGNLYRNPFAEPPVRDISLKASVVREPRIYRIAAVHLDRNALEPGSVLEVRCRLEGYRAEPQTITLHLPVPADIAPGTPLRLVVGSPAEIAGGLGQSLSHRLRTATGLAAYVEALGEIGRDDRLEATLVRAATGVIAAGRLYDQLPPTAAHLLASQAGGVTPQRTRMAVVSRVMQRVSGPVTGRQTANLIIRDGATAEQETD